MTTTPEPTKGVPRIEGNPSPTLRADHNDLSDWVRDNVDAAVTNFADLPTSGNWAGRRVYVTTTDAIYIWKSSALGWARAGAQSRVMAWGTTAGGSGSYKYAGDVTPLMRMGQVAGRTNGSGTITWSFDVPFPNGISGVVLMPHQNTGYSGTNLPVLFESSLTKSSFGVLFPGLSTGQVFLPFIAYGY